MTWKGIQVFELEKLIVRSGADHKSLGSEDGAQIRICRYILYVCVDKKKFHGKGVQRIKVFAKGIRGLFSV